MKKAIFYLTFNGIFNDTNGIATQTINTINMFSKHRGKLRQKYGEFDFYIICPKPNTDYWGYDKEYFESTKQKLHNIGIELHLCTLDYTIDFWDVKNWQILCDCAADYIINKSKLYSKTMAICVDTPYINVGQACLKKGIPQNLTILLVLYGGAYVVDEHIDKQRLLWEQHGINAKNISKNIKIADVGNAMTRILKEKYDCQDCDFLPYTTGIENSPINSTNKIQHKGHPIIFAFGRAHPTKGFEAVIKAAARFKSDTHLILMAIGTPDNECIKNYIRLQQTHYPEMTLITNFNRELPKYIISSNKTAIVICPSYKECFSNIPLETAILAKNSGAVLLCRNIESYTEFVKDSVNGFIFAGDDNLANKISEILSLSEIERLKITKNAYKQVTSKYQMIDKFEELLNASGF